jgi:hypothetical protein
MLKQQIWLNLANKIVRTKRERPIRVLKEHALSVVGVIFALVLMASVVTAETVSSKKWGFSATFPGQSKMSVSPIQTQVGKVTLVTYSSGNDNDTQAFIIALSDYPKGSTVSYNLGIEGAVNSVNGTLRSRVPYKLGNIIGFDFVIDGPSAESKQNTLVFHERIFIVGKRLYQVLYDGPMGTEQSADALSFLNSFKLQHNENKTKQGIK